jgi:hypothetical protein
MLKDTLQEHQSKDSNHPSKGMGQDQHRSTSLHEKDTSTAYPARRFNLNWSLSMDKVELRQYTLSGLVVLSAEFF